MKEELNDIPESNHEDKGVITKQVKQRSSRKVNPAAIKTDKAWSELQIKDSEIQNESIVYGNVVSDAELIPFERKMSKSSMFTDSFISIESALQSQKLLEQFVNELLIADVDYGFIQGYSKPSLLKSGAEKICNFFRLVPDVEVLNRIDDFQVPFFSREIKISLQDSANNKIYAVGIGSCNSMEQRYRREDIYSVQNTILKIAKKRALIDGVLNLSALSSRFTQDIEEFEALEGRGMSKKPITIKQYQYLCDLIKNNRVTREEYFEMLHKEFQTESLKQLDSIQVSRLISLLKDRKK